MRLAVTGQLDSGLFDSLLKQCEPCLRGDDHELDLDLSGSEWAYPTGLVPLANSTLPDFGSTPRWAGGY